MRNVLYAINLTADGCCDHTKVNPSEEMMDYYTDIFRECDTIVWGRKTYELMIPYWPEVAKDPTAAGAELRFAKALNEAEKIVFSRTLESAEAGTRIIRDDLAGEFLKLKQAPGKKISIGGVDLPQQLIALGLVDEFRFVIHPRIAGEGRRLVAETPLTQPLDLELVETKPLVGGAIALHYVKR
jgi:dihydrofolate reductase